MKKVLCLITMLFTIALTSACGVSTESKLVGQWVVDEDYGSFLSKIEFFSDGTYTSSHSNYEGSYSVDNSRLKLQGLLVESKTFTFDVDNKELTLYNSYGDIYCIYNKVTD